MPSSAIPDRAPRAAQPGSGADALAATLVALPIEWRGAAVLVFGRGAGTLAEQLAARHASARIVALESSGAAAAERARGDGESIERLCGDPLDLAPLQNRTFDAAIAAGGLETLGSTRLMQTLEWLHDHLRPGAAALLRVRTILASDAAEDEPPRRVSFAHVLFPRPAADRAASEANRSPARAAYCGATWLTAYRRAGFELVDVVRVANGGVDAALRSFGDKLSVFERGELDTCEVIASLRSPTQPADMAFLAPGAAAAASREHDADGSSHVSAEPSAPLDASASVAPPVLTSAARLDMPAPAPPAAPAAPRPRALPHAAQPHKLTLAWGHEQAKKLYDNTLARFEVDWRGATTLDFGCAWGYLAKYIAEHAGAAASWGVDLLPQWDMLSDHWSPQSVPNLRLIAGDVTQAPELQAQTFDVIYSIGTLMLIPPTPLHAILAWFFERLRPGGCCILRTRTFLSYCGGDLHRELKTPLPHLLFARRTIDAYLRDKTGHGSRYMNPMCAASYLTLFARVGFEIAEAIRVQNPLDESVYAAHADRLGAYDSQELRTTEVMALLRKPAVPPDIRALEAPR